MRKLRVVSTNQNYLRRCPQRGIALVLAAVMLAVCAVMLASLSVGMTLAKRRLDYHIEYQKARYGLDSALKYIRTVLPEKSFSLADRAGMPDFSDQFWMTPAEQTDYLTRWLAQANPQVIEKALKPDSAAQAASAAPLDTQDFIARLAQLFGLGNAKRSGSADPTADSSTAASKTSDGPMVTLPDGRIVRPQDLRIPGPYNADWPLVQEPIYLEISQAKVTITIEDENAKLPLSWFTAADEKLRKSAQEAFEVFGDWMGYDRRQRQTIQEQLALIATKKQFQINPSPLLLTVPVAGNPQQPQQQPAGAARRRRRTATLQTGTPAPQQQTTLQRPASGHAADFAKLFHSALMDHQLLAEPAVRRTEPTEAGSDNPLRYLALWGSQRVNINTAPRPVLEATLSIGGMAEEAAEQIIRQRQQQPFKDLDDLKNRLWQYSSIFDKTKELLTTESNFFLIRIRSVSGHASATCACAVIKESNKVESLVVLYGY